MTTGLVAIEAVIGRFGGKFVDHFSRNPAMPTSPRPQNTNTPNDDTTGLIMSVVAGYNIHLGEEVFLGRCGEISCIQQVREDNIARGLPIDTGLDGASIVTIQVRETESVKTFGELKDPCMSCSIVGNEFNITLNGK